MSEQTPDNAPDEATEFFAWAMKGLARGWVGPAVCETHDSLPMSAEEETDGEEDGEYPCIHILRLYTSPEHKAAVEANHPASIWRQPRTA